MSRIDSDPYCSIYRISAVLSGRSLLPRYLAHVYKSPRGVQLRVGVRTDSPTICQRTITRGSTLVKLTSKIASPVMMESTHGQLATIEAWLR